MHILTNWQFWSVWLSGAFVGLTVGYMIGLLTGRLSGRLPKDHWMHRPPFSKKQ